MDLYLKNTAQKDKKQAFYTILSNKQLRTLFQPIVSLKDGSTYGYEALSRGPAGTSFHSPVQLFSFAEKEGCLYKLEKVTRELAFEAVKPLLSKKEKVFINLSAQVIYDPSFTPGHTISLLNWYGLSPEQVVFEITERSAIDDFKAFCDVLYHYRKQGFKIAIDDAGSGYSSLQAISELLPDYIKIDRSLIQNIDKKEINQSILEVFVTFAQKAKAELIAEGIETEEELKTVLSLGIQHGQGYVLARPNNPVEKIPSELMALIHSSSFNRHLQKPLTVTEHDHIIILKDGKPAVKTAAKNLLHAYQQVNGSKTSVEHEYKYLDHHT